MTSLLLALLIWILIGGALWLWLVKKVKISREAGKELGLSIERTDYLRTSRLFLIAALIIGPALIIPSVLIGTYNWVKELYKGDSKCPKN